MKINRKSSTKTAAWPFDIRRKKAPAPAPAPAPWRKELPNLAKYIDELASKEKIDPKQAEARVFDIYNKANEKSRESLSPSSLEKATILALEQDANSPRIVDYIVGAANYYDGKSGEMPPPLTKNTPAVATPPAAPAPAPAPAPAAPPAAATPAPKRNYIEPPPPKTVTTPEPAPEEDLKPYHKDLKGQTLQQVTQSHRQMEDQLQTYKPPQLEAGEQAYNEYILPVLNQFDKIKSDITSVAKQRNWPEVARLAQQYFHVEFPEPATAKSTGVMRFAISDDGKAEDITLKLNLAVPPKAPAEASHFPLIRK